MKNLKLIAVILFGLFLGGCGDPNAKITYGDTGFPKNCRAIIKTNIDGYRSGEYGAKEIIESIDRNCGENGYSWGK